MSAMPMPGGGTMAMIWMPMCGQSWIAAAASFLAMWSVMMVAMMLPSLTPMLWRHRRAVGQGGGVPPSLPTALFGAGYLLVWLLLGAAIYPLGTVVMAATMRHPELGRAAPLATAIVLVIAGALQLTRWKARHLACCRGDFCRESPRCGGGLRADPSSALRQGMRLGLHCTQCCAGLTAVLLVTGIMDLPGMIAVTAAITLERLAPAGERIARAIGVMMVGSGMFLIVRAAGLP